MMPTDLADESLEHLRSLLRFDTSNPPGKEMAAARYLAQILEREGFSPELIESAPGRGNVVARLKGNSNERPLLLLSHLDVVPAEAEHWNHDPFGAEIHEGYLYGRGAVDMKHMVAMSLMCILGLKRAGKQLQRDLIFAAVADEESGGEYGAAYLVEKHPALLDAEFALCEVGGFRTEIKGRTYYPVQVAERGAAWCRARFHGQSGHASVPDPNSAPHRMARALVRLGKKGLPLHVTETVRHFVEQVAAQQKTHVRLALKALLNPMTHSKALALLDPEQARLFAAQLHNTASPTQIRSGALTNVIPSSAEVDLDGRVLPGQTWESFRKELAKVLGEEVELECLKWMEPLTYSYDTPLFDLIRRVIVEREPEAEVVPYLLTGLTDAKHLDKLGVVTYGFAPMNNEKTEQIARLAHGHNERIGVEAFRWGQEVLYDVVERFCCAPSSQKVVGGLMEDVMHPSQFPAVKALGPEPEEVPAEEAPKEEAPKEEAPKEEAPKEEAPKEEAPKEATGFSKRELDGTLPAMPVEDPRPRAAPAPSPKAASTLAPVDPPKPKHAPAKSPESILGLDVLPDVGGVDKDGEDGGEDEI